MCKPPVNHLALQFKYILNRKYDDKCTYCLVKKMGYENVLYKKKLSQYIPIICRRYHRSSLPN